MPHTPEILALAKSTLIKGVHDCKYACDCPSTDDGVLLCESSIQSIADIIATLTAERDALKATLKNLIQACDNGRRLERGVGGMTTESQLRRTVINGVSAWVVEEARETLLMLESKDAPQTKTPT